MNGQPTPGPWTLRVGAAWLEVWAGDTAVAHVYSSPETMADGRLIAASPTLLALAERVAALKPPFDMVRMAHLKVLAEEAVTAATGEARS